MAKYPGLSADVLKHGDLLRLILDKGKWIEGSLMTRTDVPLSVPSVLLRMRVQTNEKIAGSSGSPIVHAQTGRVVGVMQAARDGVAGARRWTRAEQ